MLHLYASLLRRVSLIEAVRKPPREEPWVCAVCLLPLGNIVSLKGHVRFFKLIVYILSCVLWLFVQAIDAGTGTAHPSQVPSRSQKFAAYWVGGKIRRRNIRWQKREFQQRILPRCSHSKRQANWSHDRPSNGCSLGIIVLFWIAHRSRRIADVGSRGSTGFSSQQRIRIFFFIRALFPLRYRRRFFSSWFGTGSFSWWFAIWLIWKINVLSFWSKHGSCCRRIGTTNMILFASMSLPLPCLRSSI